MAEHLETNRFTHQDSPAERQFVTVGILHKELERNTPPKVSLGLLTFINDLLVVNHTKRPTAAVDASIHLCIDYNVANG